ncbi:type 1 glutamine amidotransferase [Candidatus Nitronereus thalassa]|uniref:Type 1 glutamine amidotransferase n=1 Tax=Candidatus Nitronereus thalassa TaxID=3020898 RepID=A0ABU3KA10_9BACT|nr:type 1 glutamine amidotransferase [Candidatus Nitronereus thalassa]MDT7043230.1 type 1 glutamine amidotransferase [Candidatus Nitronereus thalassa]
MKTAICLQHVPFEGPGKFQSCLERYGFSIKKILVPSEGIPQNFPDLLLIMGGPMSVNDPDPWIKKELEFIRRAIDSGIPVLGVCLGSQLMATALGGSVKPGARLEIGPTPIVLTVEEDIDPVFGAFPHTLEVFQWHGEGLTLPSGAILLASSEHFPVQAFRYGEHAYGLLFHLELEREGVEALCRECASDVQKVGTTTKALLEAASRVLPQSHELADRLIAHITTV